MENIDHDDPDFVTESERIGGECDKLKERKDECEIAIVEGRYHNGAWYLATGRAADDITALD